MVAFFINHFTLSGFLIPLYLHVKESNYYEARIEIKSGGQIPRQTGQSVYQ